MEVKEDFRPLLIFSTTISIFTFTFIAIIFPLLFINLQQKNAYLIENSTDLLAIQDLISQKFESSPVWRNKREIKTTQYSSPYALREACCSCQQGPAGPPGKQGKHGKDGKP
uniref:Nematode cuticle collagen N-terminal domain-containing protein n=1 Tax=Meloidogyne floridensis TaxID=298350 RepID=A0A915PEX1_9BILA